MDKLLINKRPTTFHVDLTLKYLAECDRIRAERERERAELKAKSDRLAEEFDKANGDYWQNVRQHSGPAVEKARRAIEEMTRLAQR